jgi:RimJ/RimL family protein N-acetyltransferase
MEVFLETERTVLRRFTESDVDNLLALDGDPEVMRFLDDGKVRTRDRIERETLPVILAGYHHGGGYWAAIDRTSGAFLGWALLRWDHDRTYELGYRLLRSAWGRGYATELAQALVHKAFTELGADRVTATTMTVNAGSRRVMDKAGLRFVRTFFEEWPEYLEGAEHGDVLYALDRADWGQR